MNNDRIKIVYSWIGPRGPIWNTELPNVLSFANVAEGTQSSSHKFWADDLWNRLFGPRQHLFEMYASFAIDVEDTRPFIFPYSLTWRTEFTNYFCGNTGIFEFAHMPNHLLRLMRQHNGYVLLDHSVEAFMNDGHINALHGYFRGVHGIPLHKIIYLTGAMNSDAIYNNYCDRNSISQHRDERLTIIPYPSSHQLFSTSILHHNDDPVYTETSVPEKLFLMWNRRFRRHRIEMVLCLEKNNLVDRSYISFNDVDVERPTSSFINVIDIPNLLSDPQALNITRDTINRFTSKLPLVIDGETNINQMCEDNGNVTRKYYQNSLVSIITETNFTEREVTLTEKSFKPVKEKHPFIIVGAPGALQAMRSLGFKTFGEFWNEDYDTTECPRARMAKLSLVTEQIGNWNTDQILEFRRKVKPILEFNYEQLKQPSSEIAIQRMVKHIRENII